MCGNITEQLLKDVPNCVTFSSWMNLQISEAHSRLLVFIRMVFEDFSIKEELLGMISSKSITPGQELYYSLYSFVTKANVPLLLMGQNQ
jgi:hypothetical protein